MKYLIACLIITSGFILTECEVPRSGIFILHLSDHDDGTALVSVQWSSSTDGGRRPVNCEIVTEQFIDGTIYLNSSNVAVKSPTPEEIDLFLEICPGLPKSDPNVHSRSSSEEEDDESANITALELRSSVMFFLPGTKWCGPGNKSSSYDDLGIFRDTDSCCRAHDHCEDFMETGETKHNLTNKSEYTRLSCECDNEFYDCLKSVNSYTSRTVLYVFFKLLNRLCYALDYPGKCTKYRTFLRLKCKQWEKDSDAEKIHKWLTMKQFRTIAAIDSGESR